MQHRRPAEGYTLIEVVVALALLALLATLVVESLRFAAHTEQAVERRTSRVDDVVNTQNVLRRLLQRMEAAGAPPSTPPSFFGSERMLQFTAPCPRGGEGRCRYTLGLRAPDRPQRQALILQWQSAVALPSAAPSDEEILLSGVSSAQFSYYMETSTPDGPQWQTSSGTSPQNPLLIRMRIHFFDGAADDWPEFYVRPRRTAPIDCRFDWVAQRCR